MRVDVVTGLGGHRDQGEPGGDRLLDTEDVLRVGGVLRLDELAAEEAVGDRHVVPRRLPLVGAADVRGVVRPVGLGGQEAEPVVLVLPLVDQVFLVDPLGLVRPALGEVVPNGGECEGDRGQPLLAVDHQPARERRLVLRGRGEHHGAEEVRARFLPGLQQVHLIEDVAPQLGQLLLCPGVRPLVERHLELLGPPLHEVGEQRLFSLHSGTRSPLDSRDPAPIRSALRCLEDRQ